MGYTKGQERKTLGKRERKFDKGKYKECTKERMRDHIDKGKNENEFKREKERESSLTKTREKERMKEIMDVG